MTAWLFDGLPGAQRVSLNWSVVTGPSGQWGVVASDREQLQTITDALGRPPGEPVLGRWSNGGTVDGRRLAQHLRSWSNQAEAFASPEDVGAFRAGMQLLSRFAEGVERCRWTLLRPAADRAAIDVEILLSPPDSAR